MRSGVKVMKKEEFDKAMDRNEKLWEGIGALKIINKISDNFKVADGSIYIPYTEWIAFIKPYTELPVEE
jgi:hypothetical protein